MLRVTALVPRFINNLRAKKDGQGIGVGQISASEVKQAERLWVKATQIELGQQANYDQLAQRLGIVEKEGLLRCQGKLKHAELDQEGREPLILPRGHPFNSPILLLSLAMKRLSIVV